jgi:hypothetical protein
MGLGFRDRPIAPFIVATDVSVPWSGVLFRQRNKRFASKARLTTRPPRPTQPTTQFAACGISSAPQLRFHVFSHATATMTARGPNSIVPKTTYIWTTTLNPSRPFYRPKKGSLTRRESPIPDYPSPQSPTPSPQPLPGTFSKDFCRNRATYCANVHSLTQHPFFENVSH